MTPEAKNKLCNTIYALRERLLTDFQNAADSAYRLSIPAKSAGLSEENRIKRERLDSWLDEQARSETKGKKENFKAARERHYRTAIKLAAATFLNRIIVIRHMEAVGLIKPAVVSGGWKSPGYREFRDFAPALLKDDTEGFSTLLRLIYDELALDLPGLFGDVGVSSLFPVPASTLRAVVEAFEQPELESVWADDMTLGWVYQFWNDPERKALDEKVRNRGKIEHHEIAAKTQLFTDRYIVEWLLQNSLNNFWLAICAKNGWTPDARKNGTLDALAERRQNWRERRESGEIPPEAMTPIETDEEDRWKYWVETELTGAFIQAAPDSIRLLKMIDPAVGSGHFLIIAFMLLVAFYREEARHRGEDWTDREIAESIIENNLHGVDIDPRAVQIAAAALWLKAKSFCREASPKIVNLVASNLGLASLPDDDPAIRELKREVETAAGIPEPLTDKIIHALKGADYLGSLLKVDDTIDDAIREHERSGGIAPSGPVLQVQFDMFEPVPDENTRPTFEQARGSILEKLDAFLEKRTGGHDLGLRLRGKQLAAGVRFVRLVKEGWYHLVLANPPYHSTSKMADATQFQKMYANGNQDLFAGFMIRCLQLAQKEGITATVTLSNWLYLGIYEKLRSYIMDNAFINIIADLGKAAFSSGSMLINASMNVFENTTVQKSKSVAVRPFTPEDVIVDPKQIPRNEAVLCSGSEIFAFDSKKLKKSISGQPLIYWWDDTFLNLYAETKKIEEVADIRQGMASSNDKRYLRSPWEVNGRDIHICDLSKHKSNIKEKWVPFVKGAAGKIWFEPLTDVIEWQNNGLEVKSFAEKLYKSYTRTIKNESYYFLPALAFPSIGNYFSARKYRYRSVFGNAGLSVFPKNLSVATCVLNSKISKNIVQALNPTVNFLVGDVNRLPLFEIKSSDKIFFNLEQAFTQHESTRETSIEFKKPGPSAWNYAQEWAQKAVDRPEGEPLPEYNPVYEDPPPVNYISFAVGVALGRFGANGEGILNEAPESALPDGILYLSAHTENDGLNHPACRIIKDAWEAYGGAVSAKTGLKKWLMQSFFKDVHLNMYEKRPIYFPLSSKRKNFVALVSIHRWTDTSLQTLLADYLMKELNQLDGELADLMESRNHGDRTAQAYAEGRYVAAKIYFEELKEFCELVRRCAEQGPPPASEKDTPRERDARFKMDLDDGVMINSAALWPLLEPQWKQPKKWWSELCNAKGRKDYDWAHLAARYFPERVDAKCKEDPSLAVAHGCFWKYHPEKAYQWELRLQDEISPDFTIDEADSDGLRTAFEGENPEKVKELVKAETKRRERKRQKAEESKSDEDNTEEAWSSEEYLDDSD